MSRCRVYATVDEKVWLQCKDCGTLWHWEK
jgi:hypothetical protein